MAEKDGYRRYIEAAAVLGQVTRARAEELVREMMGGTEIPREQAQRWVDDVIERSRKATEDMVDIVRSEVSSQLGALGLDPDDLARQAAEILRRSAEAGRRVVADAQRAAGRTGRTGRPGRGHGRARGRSATHEVRRGAGTEPAPPAAAAAAASSSKKAAKKSAAKKAPGKKVAATRAAVKKSATKKAGAKKAGAKKAGATKRAAGGGASSASSR